MNSTNKLDCACNDTISDTNAAFSTDRCDAIGIYGLQNKLKPEKWYAGQTTGRFEDRWQSYTKS
jgi:hypothetical protein